jgi:putative ABC transport system permease protein
MVDSFYLAWKYLEFNRLRTTILIACITLIALLPLALELIMNESERQLLSRAQATPMLLGARGSALDLVMNSLYFSDEVPESIPLSSIDEVMQSGLVETIPLDVRFKARGFPVVATTLDYFDFRELKLAQGYPFALLGDCVIGSAIAHKLGLIPGDHLLSSPQTVFNIAGIYPLKMKVTGVLAPTHSADDLAVLIDIKTAMVIQGLAHGHEDLANTSDPSVIIERNETSVTANAKLVEFNEITADNIDSFHPHGSSSSFPITAMIAIPYDSKSGTLLRGRYLEASSSLQVVRPGEVIDTLIENIFRIRNVLDAVILLVGLATMLALVLVFALSLKLRQREMDTNFRLGCSRATIARLMVAELVIIAAISALICSLMLLVISHFAQSIVRILFI